MDKELENLVNALESDRVDIAQMRASDYFLNNDLTLNEARARLFKQTFPGSNVVVGKGFGMRLGYVLYKGDRFYFA